MAITTSSTKDSRWASAASDPGQVFEEATARTGSITEGMWVKEEREQQVCAKGKEPARRT